MTTVILIFTGLLVLVIGAEALVRGASRIAASAGVPPLIIGLTVVAFGTSAPELSVSIKSELLGQDGIAIGNVIGSNIFNVLFILGLSALVSPLLVAQRVIRLDVPLMIGISLLVFLMGLDGTISRLDGSILFSGLFLFTLFLILQSRIEKPEIQKEYASEYDLSSHSGLRSWFFYFCLVGGGLGLLIIGSQWLVSGAVSIAESLGVSQLIIGLTIVAAGTSLPEVATSVVASYRGERDIAVGNVVGSNIFNLLGVLGLTSVISPGGIAVNPTASWFDIPIMLGVSLVCLPIFFTGNRISRWEGVAFLVFYAAYVSYLVLASTDPDLAKEFRIAMLWFVLPLTAFPFLVLILRKFIKRERA